MFEHSENLKVNRQRQMKFIAATCVAVLIAVAVLLYVLPSTGSVVVWRRAIQVRGTSAVQFARGANLYSISCANAGNCSAVGQYQVTQHRNEAIVEDEIDGEWGRAHTLRGLSTREESLNTGAFDVSCAAPGDCAAGGTYAADGRTQAIFVVTERHDVWGTVTPLSGVSFTGTGNFSYLTSISCASPGKCSAGGNINDGSGPRAFVVDERNGVWGSVILLSGAPGYDMQDTTVSSISCVPPGNCSAVGVSQKGPGGASSFVVNEKEGVWDSAAVVPGLARVISGGTDVEISLSCATGSDCSAEGTYRAISGVTQSFLVDETNGVWGRAFNIPGIVALDGRHIEQLKTVSCGAPGYCVAGGSYGTGSYQKAFLVDEVNGRWGDPMLISGLSSLNRGHFTSVDKISCRGAGNCGAIGEFSGKAGYVQSFAVNEVNGSWNVAKVLGAPSFTGAVGAQANSISCVSSSNCAVVGYVFTSMSKGVLFAQSSKLQS
jgi:hypothetical protein